MPCDFTTCASEQSAEYEIVISVGAGTQKGVTCKPCAIEKLSGENPHTTVHSLKLLRE